LHRHGRRHGRRLRSGRRRLLDEFLPRLAIPIDAAPLDPYALFQPRPAEIWLEIGFGAGEHLADQAERHPDIGLLGAEIFVNGVAALLARVEEKGLANVRIHADDARRLLDALPVACLGRVFLLFPDPWPKRRHAGRRFVQRENLDRLARTMKPEAELRIASDDPDHVAWVLRQVLTHPAFEWTARRADDWRRRPADWPGTRYEAKAAAEGRRATYLVFGRRAPSATK
jgi:tRNA (guanine-N7-)-methyltransferase